MSSEKFPIIFPFFVPPGVTANPGIEWVQKNNAHLADLVSKAGEVRESFFAELERFGCWLPAAPELSVAHVFICKAAAKLAGPWHVPYLIDMLFWEQVLNGRDASLISILLEGIEEHGYAQDAERLDSFCAELSTLKRFCYQEGGKGPFIPLPGMVRLRDRANRVKMVCRLRGGDSEAAIVAGGAI